MGFDVHPHYCQKGPNHSQKQIIMICLNPECENKRLCCVTCIDELHRKHQLISLYKFDQMLGALVKKEQGDGKIEVLGLLEEFQTDVLKEMDALLQLFAKMVENSKDKLRGILKFARESVNFQLSPTDLEDLYAHLENAQVCRYLTLIQQAEGEALKNAETTSKTLKAGHALLQKSLSEIQKLHLKNQQDLNSSLTRLKKLFGSDAKAKALLFSKQNKALSLQVSADQKTVKRFQGAGSYPIALFEQPLSEFNNSFTVKITEQPGNKGCWLGVCVKDIVKNLNFGSCYGIGKGTWAIDQVGASHSSAYSWSHHDTNFNSQPKVGFQFLTGDTVTVRVDFQKSVVVFEKDDSVYEMPIQLKIGQIYGFVGCTYVGDVWVIP